ncbi:M23 family metallopeptidase [Brevibacillus dissolubilis]|uniref:M23 family metallopeptidase n=1 Tax=Brevibacillus dissolubilis TaxID=1844116 RepID=UPI0011164CC2|nr:M23 family metallopeptidase [Brevibacillus dissolubilis]
MQLTGLKDWLRERVQPIVRRTSQQAREVKDRAFTYIVSHKKQTVAALGTLIVAVSSVAYANHYYTSNTYSIYHVIMNGKEIGVVNNKEVVTNWTQERLKEEEAKHNGIELKLSDYITFKEENLYKGEYNNEATLRALDAEADLRVQAIGIEVNGEVVAYAADQKQADQVLAALKDRYSGGAATQSAKKASVSAASIASTPEAPETGMKEVKFKEDVKFEPSSVPAAQVLTEEKLEELLANGTYQQVVHTVQEGDCISCIAKKYGITTKDIYANNPGVTEDTLLQLGQELNVTAVRPVLTVQTVEEQEQEETIYYQMQTRTNDKLPKGEVKVIQEGKVGTKRVSYEVIKENGQVVSRKVTGQEVIEQAVDKIVERGTKVIPSRGTGRISWPASGYVSSGYGTRWGRMHKGIDIAGSGSIRAADNGRVVQAGWNGDYGNSVIIDHGNGTRTLYGHMRSISVKVGQVVSQGTKVGVMGSTGDSTGVHLHFEVIKGGRTVNPLSMLGRR